MYIALNNTQNTERIIKMFESRDIVLEIHTHEVLTFIQADDTELNGFIAYIPIYAKQLVYTDTSKELGDIVIPFEEINCIYSL